MSALFYIGLLLWAVVMLVLALDWGWQDRLFPVFFTGVAIVLIIIHLILVYFDEQLKQILPDTAETGSDQMDFDVGEDAEARTGEERERYELIMVAWASLLPIALYIIGFLYTIPLYTTAFVYYFNRDPRTAILTALVATLVVYGLFIQILGIRLPSGILFG
jgi:xanthine/uracil permease